MKNLFFITVTVGLLLSYRAANAAIFVPSPDTGAIAYPNERATYRGSYGIWYRTNEPHKSTLKKPLLLVSGFDPSGVIKISGDDENELDVKDDRQSLPLQHCQQK